MRLGESCSINQSRTANEENVKARQKMRPQNPVGKPNGSRVYLKLHLLHCKIESQLYSSWLSWMSNSIKHDRKKKEQFLAG